jgi:hypothetical protein
MKKVSFCLCIFIVFLAVTGCSSTTNIDLPFSASDVESMELYRYSVPADSQMQIITKPSDIESIINTLTSIKVKEGSYEPTAGTDTTSFRFNLSDGTDFEIIYVGYGVKKGEIMSSYIFNYVTEADVGGLWDDFKYEVVNAEESKLPNYEK